MREYELITRILHDDFLCKDNEKDVLFENQGDKHAEQRVRIVNRVKAISRMALFRFDEKKIGMNFLPFLNNHDHAPEGLRSFCDYILLVEYSTGLYIMLIELKRGGHSGFRKQIEGAACFMDYIVSSAVRIQHDNAFDDFDPHNIHYRRVRYKRYSGRVTINYCSVDIISLALTLSKTAYPLSFRCIPSLIYNFSMSFA